MASAAAVVTAETAPAFRLGLRSLCSRRKKPFGRISPTAESSKKGRRREKRGERSSRRAIRLLTPTLRRACGERLLVA